MEQQNEEPIESKGLWKQMQESWDKRKTVEVDLSKPLLIKDIIEAFGNMKERDDRHREETKKYWPDINLWPDDLPEGVYQGNIGGVKGMYSTKFRDQLKKAIKKEYEKDTTQEKAGNTEKIRYNKEENKNSRADTAE